jgi:hypothetical protein
MSLNIVRFPHPAITFDHRMFVFLLAGIPHQPDIVINSDGVALGAAADREIGGVTRFGIAALRTGPMNIYPCTLHKTHGPAKGHINSPGPGPISPIDVGSAAPVVGIVGLAGFIGN